MKEVAAKFDGEKLRWDLLPLRAARATVGVLTFGARKYAPHNWRKLPGWRWRYGRAAVGHVVDHLDGAWLDGESMLPHLAHAACCVLFLLEMELRLRAGEALPDPDADPDGDERRAALAKSISRRSRR